MPNLPSFQFYPGDWMKDPALSICSAASRGVWMDVLCLMFEMKPSGRLKTNGKPLTLEQLAVALRGDWQENLQCLKELVTNGVLKQDAGGFYSARLLRDQRARTLHARQKRAQRARENHRSSTVVQPSQNRNGTHPSKPVESQTSANVHPLSTLSSSSSSSSIHKTLLSILSPEGVDPAPNQEQNAGARPIPTEEEMRPPAEAAPLPDWLPKKEWYSYIRMRAHIFKPMTGDATDIALKRLTDFHNQGHDVRLILETSIVNSWPDLRALRKEKQSRADRTRSNLRAAGYAV